MRKLSLTVCLRFRFLARIRFCETDDYLVFILTEVTCASDTSCLVRVIKRVSECTRVQLWALAHAGDPDTVLFHRTEASEAAHRLAFAVSGAAGKTRSLPARRSQAQSKAADSVHRKRNVHLSQCHCCASWWSSAETNGWQSFGESYCVTEVRAPKKRKFSVGLQRSTQSLRMR